MATTPNAKGEESSSMIYSLMSQGLSVVVAKALISMESKYDKSMAAMERSWEAKLLEVASDMNAEIRSLRTELEETKAALHDVQVKNGEWASLHQDMRAAKEQAAKVTDHFITKLRSLSSTTKGIFEKVVDHQAVLTSLQKNVDDFYIQYLDRNETIRSFFSQTKNEIRGIVNSIEAVDENTKILTQDFNLMKHVFYHHIDAVQSKVDKCMELNLSEKELVLGDAQVSIDEHNQLRSDLEDHILECNRKIDHVLLAMEKQYNETVSRCDKLNEADEVFLLVKRQHPSNHVIAEGETNSDVSVFHVDTRSIVLDFAGEHTKLKMDKIPFDDDSTVGLEESFVEEIDSWNENEFKAQSALSDNSDHLMHNDFDDEDSLFGANANLVFLSEMNIRD